LALHHGALDGHAEDGDGREGRGHAGKVRGAAGARDDGAQPAPARGEGVLAHEVRRAVRRDDAAFVRNPELGQRVVGVAQRLPIGLAAHDDADERRRSVHGGERNIGAWKPLRPFRAADRRRS
jgi:hypothetical protein